MNRYAHFQLIALLFVVYGCQGVKDPPVPVVGVENSAALFDTEDLKGNPHDLEVGTELEIVTDNHEDDNVLVKIRDGKQGWVRRCWICDRKELDRRKAVLQLPQKVICLGWEDGGASMYGGSLSIENNKVVMKPGDSFWMDTTMKGKPFSFSGTKVLGDPNVLLLTPQNGEQMIHLAIWGREQQSK